MTNTTSAREAIAAVQGHEAWAIIRRSTRAGDRDTVGLVGGKRRVVESLLDVPLESGAPADGHAWLTGDCNRRVVRGGAWNLGAASLRSSDREWDDRNFGFTDRGFRVATSK